MNGIGNINWAAGAAFLLLAITRCPAQHTGSTRSTALARSINDFGASITSHLEIDGNLVISPLSIFNALAMVYIGAAGQTAEQMSNAFNLAANGLDKSSLNQAFRNFLDVMESSSDVYTLHLANGIFLQQEYAVDETYVTNIQTFYDSVLKVVDFVGKRTESKDIINSFVSRNTNGKIDSFLQEPLDPTAVLVLINAIYFKGTWNTQFKVEHTRNGNFHKNDGSIKSVEFMTVEKLPLRIFDDYISNYKFVDLPYKGNVSMLLALPNNYQGTPVLDMNSDLFCRINGNLRIVKMENVTIPKFQMKYRKDLVNVLKQLGILDLFESADLTGIGLQGDIAVSSVVHEAVIEVNEEGSEAAAAASPVFLNRMIADFDVFVADHPFLFYIIDNRDGLVLFSGRVSDP